MTIETKRTKREIERDLAGAQNAQEMVGQLQQVASHAEEHKQALENWEAEGGWSRREIQGRIEAESITRQIRDKQSELVLLLKECESSPLFRAIGNIYQTQALRAELIKTCQDSTYASFQRALTEAKEGSETKLSYQAVSTVAAHYGDSHTERLVAAADPNYHLLRGIPSESKAESIGHIILQLAFPPKRIPTPIDQNMGIPSRSPAPVAGAALSHGPVMRQIADNALGLTGKTQGKEQTGLFRSVQKKSPLFKNKDI